MIGREKAPESFDRPVSQKVEWCLRELGSFITMQVTGMAQVSPLREWARTGVVPPHGRNRAERIELVHDAAVIFDDSEVARYFLAQPNATADGRSLLEVFAKDDLTEAQAAMSATLDRFFD